MQMLWIVDSASRKAVAEIDTKIANVFLKIVETIKIMITPSAVDAAAQTEDEILTKISEPYDYLLYFYGRATSSQVM